ncbi:archaetidylserine decarboxylase [Muricoccus radiodurans]|uniref:archaetidylserine decarboxylase n=1 Tax=Muricoccus radiodurans TaxID=2231721 RepID=UPI003CF44759
MTIVRSALARIAGHEGINFVLTNRIPRRWATRLFGWFSRIENPVVRDLSVATWRLFADLDLSDARTSEFRSLRDVFVRRLKDGARPVHPDPEILVSPCDAIVGAQGRVEAGQVLQVKGSAYALSDLLGDADHAARFAGGRYVTLRLTSSMYHRFHAPQDLCVESVTYIPGDTWNVNPPALRRVDRLFCRNERAPIRARLDRRGYPITLVPVAAILVAGIRLGFLGPGTELRVGGARVIPCDAALRKGEEMGWFEHGSTIILLTPEGFALHESAVEGRMIRAGQPLLRLPRDEDSTALG